MQGAEHLEELGLALEADAGQVLRGDAGVADDGVVGESARGLELAGVGLVAAQVEAGGDVEGELVAAVRDAAARGPAVLVQDVEDPSVLGEAVGEGRLEVEGAVDVDGEP